MKMIGDTVICDEGLIKGQVTGRFIDWCHGHNLEVITVNGTNYMGHRFRLVKRPLKNKGLLLLERISAAYRAFRRAS